jgi:two-component system, cell cycle sensor histidine kinase and response regulator CckA
VLYISGYTDDILAHSGVLATGTLLLQKPFTTSALLGRVREVLDRDGSGAP